MADNTRGGSNDAALPNIASDDIGGVQYQRVKHSLGPDGTGVDARGLSDIVTGLETGIPGFGNGPGFDRKPTADTFTATAQTGADIDCNGSGHVYLDFKGSALTTATFIIEYSADGTNWFSPSSGLLSVTDALWLKSSSFTFTADKRLMARTAGIRKMRVKTTGTFTATNVVVTSTVNYNEPIIKVIEFASAPHNIGYTRLNKVAQYTTTQTGVALWTPASGKFIVVTYVAIGVGGTTAGAMQLWFGASADTTYTRGTDKAIFDHEFAPSATLKPGVIIGDGTGVIGQGAVDEILRVTDSAAINPLTVTVWGYEV